MGFVLKKIIKEPEKCFLFLILVTFSSLLTFELDITKMHMILNVRTNDDQAKQKGFFSNDM